MANSLLMLIHRLLHRPWWWTMRRANWLHNDSFWVPLGMHGLRRLPWVGSIVLRQFSIGLWYRC